MLSTTLKGCHEDSAPTPLHCIWSGQNAFLTVWKCSAKQADDWLASLQIRLWIFAPLTGVQCPNTNALHLIRAKCTPHCPGVLCKTGSQQAHVTSNTPLDICSTYRCAVPQYQCTASGQGKPHSSLPGVALQNRLTAGSCHCKCIFGYLLFLQACSASTPMHCI